MIDHQLSRQRGLIKGGSGLINTLIDNLPIELHLPGYNFCGPGTKLEKRLKRGDNGINPLDEACKQHDIAYAQNSSLSHRHKADLELASAAKKRWHESKDLSERLFGLGVNKLMKFKVKRGMGLASRKKTKRKRCTVKKPRVIRLPKRGGFLPLLPILGALSAVGSLAGGVTTAAKNIYEMVKKKKEPVTIGKGMYLAPYKKGMGLYLEPYQKTRK